MAKEILTVRADEEYVDAYRQAATEAGLPLSTWMREVLNDVVDAMGFTGKTQVPEGQMRIETADEHPVEHTPPPAVLPPAPDPVFLPPELGGQAPSGVPLRSTCPAAHLHFQLARGEPCRFCGGEP